MKKIILSTLLACSLFSCTKDEVKTETSFGAYEKGVLILNQGGFGKGDASVSYLSNDFLSFQNNIFALTNSNVLMGDTAQDMGFYNNLAYLVINGSNKIQVVDRFTFQLKATITTGLNNPRYIVFANDKAYISNWGNGSSTTDDYIAVMNLADNKIIANIPVVEGPEKMVVNNGTLYVAHIGGWGFGNSVSAINLSSNLVTSSIAIGDVPQSIKLANSQLYVLCSGKPDYSGAESGGKLIHIDLSSNTILSSVDFPQTSHPSNLDIEKNVVYYTINSDVYTMPLGVETLPATKLLSTSGIYGFEVNSDKIYIGDAGDYSANGKIRIYNTLGSLMIEKTVGVAPCGFYFN